ncbi:MAG: DUF7507 domain-containing protein, partial [Methanobacteriaceae archaeon]
MKNAIKLNMLLAFIFILLLSIGTVSSADNTNFLPINNSDSVSLATVSSIDLANKSLDIDSDIKSLYSNYNNNTNGNSDDSNLYIVNTISNSTNSNNFVISDNYINYQFESINSLTNPNNANTIISGKITDCVTNKDFGGVTIQIKSLSGELLATAISDSSGNYYTSFYSLDNSFNVIANYPGHVQSSTIVTVAKTNSSSPNTRYGSANLKLGTLNLTKGTNDTLIYDSNNFATGPNQYIIQIAIKNTAVTTATNVWANFSWMGVNSNFNLATGENATKFIGNIGAGQTVYVFYLVTLSSTVTDGQNRSYNVTVAGNNTGTPLNVINGNLVAREGNSQNRNTIDLIQASNNNPTVGSYITVTVKSSSSSSNYAWVSLPIYYNNNILRVVNVTTTYGSNTTNNIFIPNPNTNSYVTVWVFEVIGEGTNTFTPWILDASGNSFHYNLNTLTLNVTAVKRADLAITKVANSTSPKINDTVKFTVTATNNGPNNATSVIVTDLINTTAMDIISVNVSTGTYNNATGIWNIGNLTVNGTATITIVVRIKVTGQIINTANITGAQEDPNVNNNVATVTLAATQKTADISVNKVVDNRNPNNGAIVTFTITVLNNGPDTAIATKLTDILPNTLVLISATPSFGSFNSTTGLWTIGDLASGTQATLTLTCRVNGTGNITNVANASSSTFDPVLSNNINNDSLIAAPVADLGVVKNVNNANPLVGQNVTFTIAVTNNGPNNATNVNVYDLLNSSLIYLSSSASRGSYNNNTGTWTIGNLNVGETVYLNITVLVNASGSISNIALVSGNEVDLVSNNDKSTVTLNGQSNADLAVLKIVDKSNPNNGETVTYTITVTNNGPNTAINALLTDILPTGLIYLSSNPSQGIYNSSTGIWNIGSLSFPGTATLVITALVNRTGTIVNIVNVSSSTIDPNPSNNLDVETITANPVADLRIIKSVNSTSPRIGEQILFTIVVRNLGPDGATNVYVADILPAGMTFVSANSSLGTYNNVTGIWTIGNLANGAIVSLNIVATVTSSNNMTNIATVYGTEYDPSLVNNQDSVLVNGQSVANIKVDKFSNKNIYYIGEIITYTIKIANTGPSAASNVVVSDLLPTGLVFVSALAPAGTSYNSTTGIWTIGNFNPYTEMTLVITAIANTTGLVTNNVNITSTTYDPILVDNFNSLTVTVLPTVDVAVNKSANTSTVNIGDNVNFTINVTNKGVNNATGVVVTDPLPIGLSYVSYVASKGTYDPNTGIWTIGNLNVGETVYLNITAYVNKSSTTIFNIAEATSNELDSDTSNNRGFASVNSNNASDLVVVKTVDNGNPVNGAIINYTVIASNAGPDTAINVFLSDVLPAGLQFISASVSVGTFNATTGLWTIGNMDKDAVAILTIMVKVVSAGNISNVAIISSDTYDPNTTNNVVNLIITANKSADLEVIKNVNVTSPNVSDQVSYTITVKNNGPDNATGVILTDLLPSGLSFNNAVFSKGTYNSTTGIWTIGNLDVNESVTLVVNATLNTAGTWINNATVTGIEYDSNPTNNKAVAAINGSDIADLAVSKNISSTNPKNNDTVNFTIIVTNNGPSNALNVILNDILPANMIYVSSSASAGAYDNNTGIWTIGDLAKDATVYLNITVRLNGSGQFNNTVNVSSDTPDTDPSDNNVTLLFNVSKVVDINVTKAVNDSVVDKNEQVNFTIVVKNNGLDNATGVNLTDILPAGFEYIGSYSANGTYNNNTGIWTIGNLNAGDSVTLNIIAKAIQSNTVLVNTAVGSSNENDSNLANNYGTVTVTVNPLPSELVTDLAIYKTVSDSNPYVGDLVNFTITVSNNGPNDASLVKVADIIGPGMSIVRVVSVSQGTYNNATGIWDIGNMSVGTTLTLVLEALINTPGTLTNSVSISAEQIDPDLANNNNSVTFTALPKSDVAITKTVNNSSPYNGDIITYTLKVTNNGPNNATMVRVIDMFPDGLSYISSNGSKGTYNVSTGVWSIGNLANGETVVLTIVAQVEVENTTINNSASQLHSTGFDTNISNDFAQNTITVKATNISLENIKTANTTKAQVGDTIKYTVKIKNTGNQTAKNVKVSDKLPNGLKLIKYIASTGTYNPITGVWNIGDLAPGKTATLTMIVKAEKAGEFINTAILSGDDSENITDSFTVIVEKANKTNDTNNTAHGGYVPMTKTAIPIAVLM